MDDRTQGEAPLESEARDIERSAKAVEKSAGTLSGRAGELVDSSDRRTTLAGDRTLLAAERTYAAWVRTALASLAAGVGSTVLVKGVLPEMVGKVTGTVLVAFAAFCLVAAVWRELQGTPTTPRPDIKPLPRALLVPMNFLLLLVAVAALVGIWSA